MFQRLKDWRETRRIRSWLIRLILQMIDNPPDGEGWDETNFRAAVKAQAFAVEAASIGCRRPVRSTDVRQTIDILVRRGTLMRLDDGSIVYYFTYSSL